MSVYACLCCFFSVFCFGLLLSSSIARYLGINNTELHCLYLPPQTTASGSPLIACQRAETLLGTSKTSSTGQRPTSDRAGVDAPSRNCQSLLWLAAVAQLEKREGEGRSNINGEGICTADIDTP